MRTIIMVAILAVVCVGLSGCWFFDAKHNRKHYEVFKQDMALIHEDLDWILLMEEKSPNTAYFR